MRLAAMRHAAVRSATSRFALSRSVALAAAVLAFASGAAHARYSIEPLALREAGMLTCRLDPHAALGAGSSRHVACVFQRTGRSDMEYYDGRMDHVGSDTGPSDGQPAGGEVLSWIVSTPGGEFRSGMLIGGFVGSSADAVSTAGPGAQVFVNDRGESVLLDPYGWSSQADMDGAAGAASMELRSAKFGELR